MVPALNNVYNLGSASNQWANAFIGTAVDLGATSNQIVSSSNSVNPTTINIQEMGQPTTLLVPDPGVANGSIMIVNSANNVYPALSNFNFSNDITVQTLNYSALNPPVSASINNYQYLQTVAQTLGSTGEVAVSFDTIVLQNAANDIIQRISDNTVYDVANSGVYLVSADITDLSTGINIGSAISNNSTSVFYGSNLGGSDVGTQGYSNSSSMMILTAGQSVSVQALSTATSNGTQINGCRLSFSKIA